ncbi:DUF4240 domain-containing protein [Streptomyces bikiniensis]|uniref:DUF4240 domain-containing protein n=1 Tax=Streptomyces bikiniensis TaxID=1896 RepID=UPI001F2FEDC1|nr:DUF4240 domain-containing protein [Streptomyces bikiniensis]
MSHRPVPDIIGFAERHAEALYRLDREKFGTLPVVDMTDRDGGPFPQSSDVFLYTRCAVVAAGQTVWEGVFFDVDEFAPYTSTEYDGEWLLPAPDKAYELDTGKEWDRTARHCFESYSNRDGWPHLRNRGEPPLDLQGQWPRGPGKIEGAGQCDEGEDRWEACCVSGTCFGLLETEIPRWRSSTVTQTSTTSQPRRGSLRSSSARASTRLPRSRRPAGRAVRAS